MSTGVIARLEPVFGRIEEEIQKQFDSEVPLVCDVCRHILLAGGKRLRPLLFVLSARLCGYESDDVYYYSTAFEYLHAASLLHDDVVDGADTRRGRPAAHFAYGNREAILVGDYLFGRAGYIAAQTGLTAITQVMSSVTSAMAEGEVLQLLNAHRTDLTEEEYMDVIHRKTGRLIEGSCHLGAVLAGKRSEAAAALREYGWALGLAFQIKDDLLDFTAEAGEFGKPVGRDLDEGKVTLPVIKAREAADAADRAELDSLAALEKRSPAEMERLREILDKYNAIAATERRAGVLVNQAKDALTRLPDGQNNTDLHDLAEFILSRRS